MIVKLLTEHHLEFLSLKGACRGSSLHMSKCHIVGNLIVNLLLLCFYSYDAISSRPQNCFSMASSG